MNLARYIPSRQLQPFVKTYITVESTDGMQNTILPDSSIILAFRYQGTVALHNNNQYNSLPVSMITGLRQTPRTLRYDQQTATFLVVLQEGAAPAFFKTPPHELFGASLSLDELFPAHLLRNIEEQLSGAPNTQARIQIVETFLLNQLRQAATPDPLVANAVAHIKRAHGNIRIKALLTTLPISRDPFEKRFRRTTGTSPKQFATLIRLRHVIGIYNQTTRLTDLALSTGYYDQSHFIRDFSVFTGKSPTQFFHANNFW